MLLPASRHAGARVGFFHPSAMGKKLQQFWVTDVVEEHSPARLAASDITVPWPHAFVLPIPAASDTWRDSKQTCCHSQHSNDEIRHEAQGVHTKEQHTQGSRTRSGSDYNSCLVPPAADEPTGAWQSANLRVAFLRAPPYSRSL